MPDMRFALSTSPQRTTWAWLAEVWDLADQHEVFESAWTFDHFYPLFGDSSEDCLEGWVTLTALLARTPRALVEGKEPRVLTCQLGGHLHAVDINGEMHDRTVR